MKRKYGDMVKLCYTDINESCYEYQNKGLLQRYCKEC